MTLEDGKSYIEMENGTVRFHLEVAARGLVVDGAWVWPGPNWRIVALGAAMRHMDVKKDGIFIDSRTIIDEIGGDTLSKVLVWLENNGVFLEICGNHDITFCDVELA